jgi:hypothetical protein
MKTQKPRTTKKSKEKSVNDMTALRAFVMPDLFPFLLEVYTKDGKTEDALLEDIEKARERYKELVTASKQ